MSGNAAKEPFIVISSAFMPQLSVSYRDTLPAVLHRYQPPVCLVLALFNCAK